MKNQQTITCEINRRAFLGQGGLGLGRMALASLLGMRATSALGARVSGAVNATPLMGHMAMGHRAMGHLGLPEFPQIAPTAKRIIYLFQSGGPSHVDLFDYKPAMANLHGSELPASIRGDQRVTGMTAGQASFPVVGPFWKMRRSGPQGTWISDLLPHTQRIAGDITILKSVHTEAINHDPAMTLINTGSQQMGHASLGAWLSYGLGSENENLPAYMVLISQGTGKNPGQPLFSRLWGNGYLPSKHQGVQLRPGANPVLYLSNPPGVTRDSRRQLLDNLAQLNQTRAEVVGDPEIPARIAAYEMAYRMQTSVPDLTDLRNESASTFDRYGPESKKPGSYAANCLLARRMVERGVRFVQLFHRGWDQHIAIAGQLPKQCHDIDQASAALVSDLKDRGLLDETLVIWGGEFGRTVYSQGKIGSPSAGRDHHGRCFTMWMAGGGIRPGIEYGQSDDFCYNVAENPVHIRDLNATILHCLGIDHRQLSYKYRGLDARLTGVEEAHVVRDILI